MTGYRYPGEQAILAITVMVIFAVLALTAIPTLCLAPLVAVVYVVITYYSSKAQHQELLRVGTPISPQTSPRLAALAEECFRRLKPGAVQFFIVPSKQLNAYTFGLSKPNMVVLYSPILEVMDPTELQFVIGHELGHVELGHSWLNTLLGGLAGVPVTFAGAIILTLAFRWWNRACEFSADRAGLLACGSLNKAISALAQLGVGDINTQAELQRALALLEREDDSFGNVLGETLSSHPMLVKRIRELQKYAATNQYQRLQAQLR